jgi:hypothetical protein
MQSESFPTSIGGRFIPHETINQTFHYDKAQSEENAVVSKRVDPAWTPFGSVAIQTLEEFPSIA